jgi:hypothetical protein
MLSKSGAAASAHCSICAAASAFSTDEDHGLERTLWASAASSRSRSC